VSALCLGTMNFGGRTDEAEAGAILDRALAAGINFVDTANVYGHEPGNFAVGRGRSEAILGRALKANGRRAQVVLATKAHFAMGPDPNEQGSSRRNLIEQCEASLRRLQTDVIDLYQLHHPTNDVPIDETLRALDDLIRAGKVRYIGTSSFAAWQIMEALWVSKELGLNRFVCEQPVYNLLDRRAERELIPMAQTYGLAIIPWSPTGGGLLTGRYRRGQPPPAGSRWDAFWRRPDYLTERVFDVLDVVEAIAQAKGATPGQIALRWCLDQPGVTSPIMGPRTVAQLDDSLGALAIALSDDERQRLEAVAPPGDKTVPFYGYDGFAWTTWGPHRFR
jgi:aryl-alcohol dehydrogenase-like predicted oxidoreductase